MYALVESRKATDTWYIKRRWLCFWVPVDVRTGFERAVEQLRQIRTRGMRGNLEKE